MSVISSTLSSDLYLWNLTEKTHPQPLLAVIAVLVVISVLVKSIKVAYFHPLSRFPGPTVIVLNDLTLKICAFSGRNHYIMPYIHMFYGEVVRVAPNMVSITNKDMIKNILAIKDYHKSALYNGMELNGHTNIFSATNVGYHKSIRRVASAAFGSTQLRAMEPTIHEHIHTFLCKINQILDDPVSVKKGTKIRPRGQIDIHYFVQRLAADIFGEAAYGQKFGLLNDEKQELLDLFTGSLKRSWIQAFNPWMGWAFPWDMSLFRFAADVVSMRKGAGEQGSRDDLLQRLINAQTRERSTGKGDNEKVFTDRAVDTEAYAIMIGGSATVATPLTSTLMYLVENPDKLAKLREELDAATATNASDQLPSWDQVRSLPYLTGCINECLRLRPSPAIGLAREVTEDVTMNGWFFPKGTTVVAQFKELHYSEKYFPKANKFIPERWVPEESPFPPVQEGTFYPFSAGSRVCLGRHLAVMEMRLVIAALVCNYDLELVKGQRTDYVQFVVISLATGSYVLAMKKRDR